jgi:hypothetical protein
MTYYVGVGARNTPPQVLDWMERTGEMLARYGYTLRSGGAFGADSAFEKGCDKAFGKKEIFLPWKGFQYKEGIVVSEDDSFAFHLAENFHPAWDKLSPAAKKLMARNTRQIFGPPGESLECCEERSAFLVCYTDGGQIKGGTGQALRMAEALKIPIFNAGAGWAYEALDDAFENFLREEVWKEKPSQNLTNILDVKEGVICQQVNCQNVMGAGLAKQIAARYPVVKEKYHELCGQFADQEKRSAGLFGRWQKVKIAEKLFVVNIFSQDNYGNGKKNGVVYTDREKLLSSIADIAEHAARRQLEVYIPAGIGCGYGGENWEEVEPLIKQLPSTNITIVYPEKERERDEAGWVNTQESLPEFYEEEHSL